MRCSRLTFFKMYSSKNTFTQLFKASQVKCIKHTGGSPNNQFHLLPVLWVDQVAIFRSHEHNGKAERGVPETRSMTFDHSGRQDWYCIYNYTAVTHTAAKRSV